jgi:hypothetical protein
MATLRILIFLINEFEILKSGIRTKIVRIRNTGQSDSSTVQKETKVQGPTIREFKSYFSGTQIKIKDGNVCQTFSGKDLATLVYFLK